jgi:hypothetical protein
MAEAPKKSLYVYCDIDEPYYTYLEKIKEMGIDKKVVINKALMEFFGKGMKEALTSLVLDKALEMKLLETLETVKK